MATYGPNAFTTKSRAKLGGYTGRMTDLSPSQRRTAGVGQAGEGSTAWQKLQPGYTPAPTTPATNGTATATGLSPQDIAAQKLALALRGQGVDWNYTVGSGLYAPQASLVGGTAWKRIQNMPSLYKLMLDAANASGVGNKTQADYLAEIGLFQHTAPSYQQVSYGW